MKKHIILDLKTPLINSDNNNIKWELLDVHILKKIIIHYNYIKIIKHKKKQELYYTLYQICGQILFLLFFILIFSLMVIFIIY